jgi:lysophospholipase L1-like esterase
MIPPARNILFVLCLIAAAATAAMPSESSQRSYLALGDSVVFGFINAAGFEYVNPENFVGFPDYVGLGLRLNVFDAGCPGETTASFFSASAPDLGCRFFKSQAPLHVAYTGTQSSYALSFLAKHPQTRLVSILLGANDLFLLQGACAGDPTCIANGLPQVLTTLGTNMATILAEIRGAGYRGVIVVANYYSLDYTNASGTEITGLLNQALAAAAQTQGAVVADVFSAFQVAASTPFAAGQTCKAGLLNSNGSLNQFSCDVHPSQSGQKLIARAIEAAYMAAVREQGD